MNDKLISVIVANFNNAQWLPQCLESIFQQTHTELEVVVVDDCSTDNSREIISAYESRYPGKLRPVLLKHNVGVAQARHEGILQAKGKYLTSLDADDFFFSVNKLEEEIKLVNFHRNNFNKEVIAFSNIVQVDATGNVMPAQQQEIFQGGVFRTVLSRTGFIPRDMLMYSTMYFEAGGYDSRFKTHEDWDLKIRLAHKYEFYFTNVDGIAYRRHDSGLSNISFDLRMQNLVAVFEKNMHLVDNKAMAEEIRTGFWLFMKKKIPGFKFS